MYGIDYVFNASDSVYIPKRAVHSLANKVNLPLHWAKMQTGGYLSEKNIAQLGGRVRVLLI